MLILPAMNTLWFWFDKKTRRDLHGTPEDVMRKYHVLDRASCLNDGLEVFLIPSRLDKSLPFDAEFLRKFRKLPYRSLHIGDTDQNFLDGPRAHEDLVSLSGVISNLNVQTLIIHAHHFQENRQHRKEILTSALNGCNILIENNGFDNEWGGSTFGVRSILEDCPEFNLCLDIAHVKDFQNLSMDSFFSDPAICSRIREIHYSYSTIQHTTDPYEDLGYPGYGPYHAMFSVLGVSPSQRTKEFISQYPVVIEGILPLEDKNLDYLKKEVQQIQ